MQKINKCSDSKSQMHRGLRVPCTTAKRGSARQKAYVSCLILSVSQ